MQVYILHLIPSTHMHRFTHFFCTPPSHTILLQHIHELFFNGIKFYTKLYLGVSSIENISSRSCISKKEQNMVDR